MSFGLMTILALSSRQSKSWMSFGMMTLLARFVRAGPFGTQRKGKKRERIAVRYRNINLNEMLLAQRATRGSSERERRSIAYRWYI
jgi:hypothetical protein